MKIGAIMRAAVLLLTLGVLVSPATVAQAAPGDVDAFQRYILFHNEMPFTIFPVIQAPQDKNCGTGGLMRIIVNDQKEGAGVRPGNTVKVAIPKDKPCAKGAFYDAVRIYVLVGKDGNSTDFVEEFEGLLSDANQKTIRDTHWDTQLCPGNACWVGKATADYGHDAPGQLLEYTIISQNPADGTAFPDPNDPRGIPFIDFDVSYVDDAYLPVTMALGDGGATQFMGSTLQPGRFNGRLTSFLKDASWSRYAAYADRNWNSSDKDARTVFSDLVDRTDRLPSGNILVVDARTGGLSSFYKPTWDGKYPRACRPTTDPGANFQCSLAGLTGNCCPNDSGQMLGCCDVKNFLIDQTTGRFTGTSVREGTNQYVNPTLTNIVTRWEKWRGTADPCSPSAMPKSPALDQVGFCNAFNKTLDFVWTDFLEKDSKTPEKTCSSIQDPAKQNQCLVAAIIGYDIKSGYNPETCGKCPTNCPASCTEELQRNESVQALLRGLPWTPAGDPQTCQKCPSATECPNECVIPPTPSPKATLYHRDKFLHFWAPYDSPYNLNPYARFVHNADDGLSAPGAYSFSIDDFYGNFGGPGSTLIVDVGGTQVLPNKEPFDPYKQYRVNWGPGWDHASVCGRAISVPAATRNTQGLSVPVSFWKDGKKQPMCDVTLYATADESQFVKYRLQEDTYGVKDAYTGQSQQVAGLKGVFADRPPAKPAPDNAYCAKNSTPALVAQGKCRASLSAGGGIQSYVALSDSGCLDPLNAACGKPMINLNVPALK